MKFFLTQAQKWSQVKEELDSKKMEVDLTIPKSVIHPSRSFGDFRLLRG